MIALFVTEHPHGDRRRDEHEQEANSLEQGGHHDISDAGSAFDACETRLQHHVGVNLGEKQVGHDELQNGHDGPGQG